VEAAVARRRAGAWPTLVGEDDWVERDIMVVLSCCFLARRHREMSDRLRVRCSLVPLPLATERNG
jgi:hypothetical protein